MNLQGLSYGTFGGQSKRDLFPRGGSQGSNVSSILNFGQELELTVN